MTMPNDSDGVSRSTTRESVVDRDERLQADPELKEGPSSGSRIAIYGVAIAILLGAVFYGLSSQSPDSNTAQTTQSKATDSRGNASSNIRDVTPNREQSAASPAVPAQTVQPPQANPTGTQVDRSKGPER